MSSRAVVFLSCITVPLAAFGGGCASGGASDAWQRTRDWEISDRVAPEQPEEGAQAQSGGGDLGSLLGRARSRNPSLKAAFSRWRAALLDVSRATRLPEPEVSYMAFIGTGMMPVMMQRHQLVLKYSVPWPTRYGHAERAALERAAGAEQRLHDLAREVERRVTEAWLELWRVRALRTLRAEQLEVIRGLVEAATARLRTGENGLVEVQRLKVAELLAADALVSLDAQEASAAAMLSAALGEEGGEAPALVEGPEALYVEFEGVTVDELEARIVAHPRISGMEREASSMEHAARAEETESLPMIGLEAGWMEMSPGLTPDLGTGADIFMLGVMLRLPLWQGSYADAADTMRATGQAARDEAEAIRHALHAALRTEVATLNDARRRVSLYRDEVIPHVAEAFASALGGWRAGRGDLNALLGLQQQMLDLRVMSLEAEVDAAKARIGIAELVGTQDIEREDP